MIRIIIAVYIFIFAVSLPLYAEENNPDPVAAQQNQSADPGKVKGAKGVDLVTDAAAAVVTKAKALLSLDLEITMSPDTEKYKNKNGCTVNAIGERVPRSTITKTSRALY